MVVLWDSLAALAAGSQPIAAPWFHERFQPVPGGGLIAQRR